MITEDALLAAAAEILIVNDLFDDVIAEADSHTVDQAVVMRATISRVIARARDAIAALDIHLTSEMELYEPIRFDGNEYTVKRKAEKVRFDHGSIAGAVQREALTPTEDEEEVSARDAVRRAVQIMRDIYLSDSTTAKTGQLKRYGIDRRQVETKELGDKYVAVIPLMAP